MKKTKQKSTLACAQIKCEYRRCSNSENTSIAFKVKIQNETFSIWLNEISILVISLGPFFETSSITVPIIYGIKSSYVLQTTTLQQP